MREDVATSAWITTADDNPFQQVCEQCDACLLLLAARSLRHLCLIVAQALKAIDTSAHRRLKGERARGSSVSQDRF